MLARLDAAFTDAGLLHEIERRGLEIAAAIDARSGPFAAEIVPDCEPLWHLVETLPGDERKAQYFLACRRFGVFLPAFSETTLKYLAQRGFHQHRLIFPRHLFVRVWDVRLHWRRIAECPGVCRILCDQHEHPVIVPDDTILQVRGLQVAAGGDREVQQAVREVAEDAAAERPPLPKRSGKRRSRRLRKRYKAKVSPTVDTSWLPLDGEQRNRALQSALGVGL